VRFLVKEVFQIPNRASIRPSLMIPRSFILLAACCSLLTRTSAVNVFSIVVRRILGLNDDGHSMASSSGEAMLVVGAGFGRTGTESLCAALTQMGFKTYHGSKALSHAHLPLWNSYFAALTSDTPDIRVFDALEKEGFNGEQICFCSQLRLTKLRFLRLLQISWMLCVLSWFLSFLWQPLPTFQQAYRLKPS